MGSLLTGLGEPGPSALIGVQRRRPERLRALLTDWRCLTDEIHAELHADLPPIP